jgi:predicted neuraminidase
MPVAEPIFRFNPAAPSCHAATIVEPAPGQLLAAWFAGSYEGHPDVAIWLAACEAGRWTSPRKVADVAGVPLWNPVLYRDAGDDLWLFFKIGPDVPSWTGAYLRSRDGGQNWSGPVLLPAGITGPAKNKPITLSGGAIAAGASSETWRSWSCWLEVSGDAGRTWRRYGPITPPAEMGAGADDAAEIAHAVPEVISAKWDTTTQSLLIPQTHRGVIQPALWEHAPGRLRMLMRPTRRIGRVCLASSEDFGRTWSPAEPLPIPNPNSGLDAVRLADGRILLACNPVPEGRTPLAILVSEDNGTTWTRRLDLETGPGEYSYPSVIQAGDGQVHVVATYRRQQIYHYRIHPRELDAAASAGPPRSR